MATTDVNHLMQEAADDLECHCYPFAIAVSGIFSAIRVMNDVNDIKKVADHGCYLAETIANDVDVAVHRILEARNALLEAKEGNHG
ncbi:hypothetical protein RM530_05670 [Algiphilus sp. W345]|uniref:Uncharacterized protein n=1 Tax=Banduia mediterranea TaxID=3075609 RepID=A0ABU2WG53_9GAMM|nr:hypothetical protein [Algiphilus sp. W345]MDT0496851.1 hypothetical protein [Algiphilus sp. W345]